ncbi:MAG: Clp protease N-terminal domain-containing protein, partial [Gammaproteobacteria bacterium]
MLSKELEYTLNVAFKEAREKRHEFMTVEHLLLVLLDNPTAATVLRACGADLQALRKDLEDYLTENFPELPEDDDRDTQPTLGFQRVLQRAVFHVQSSGGQEVTGANVLVAIFGERESHAVYFLSKQNIARIDVVNYISHGITKVSEDELGDDLSSAMDDETRTEEPGKSPLEGYTINLNEQARLGKIDPLIGRRNEIQRTVQ